MNIGSDDHHIFVAKQSLDRRLAESLESHRRWSSTRMVRISLDLALKAGVVLVLVTLSSTMTLLATRYAGSHCFLSNWTHWLAMGDPLSDNNTLSFFANLSVVPGSLCPGVGPDTPSYSGYIGLKHDTNSSPRRSFFWYVFNSTYLCGEGSYQRLFFRYFGAESHDPKAPIMCVRELISRSLYSWNCFQLNNGWRSRK